MNLTVTLSSKHGSTSIVPELLVLHDTVGYMPGTYGWLMNPANKVSVHFLVCRDGRVYQMGRDNWAMWHAGESRYTMPDGRVFTSVNNHSIGIEIEHIPTTMSAGKPYTKAQLEALDELVYALYKRNSSLKLTVGHKHVAMPRGRKSDPELDVTNWSFEKVKARIERGEIVMFTKNPAIDLPPAAYPPGTTMLSLTRGSRGYPIGDDVAGMVEVVRFGEAANRIRMKCWAVDGDAIFVRDGDQTGEHWLGWKKFSAA